MAKKRLDKTLADYVVIAISPALIMTLIGSLVFFLLEVSYRGQFESRLHWIMFWFVFAAVLVARIAIQEGREHALFFGIAMCAVTAIAIWRFADAVLLGWLLLAVVWWCSSKLTWDCTLIDDSEDASGEGLLQVAGIDNALVDSLDDPQLKRALAKKLTEEEEKTRKKEKPAKSTRKKKAKNDKPVTEEQEITGQKSRPHTPGLWVVYFSLAALPLFGIGQLLIPASNAGRRSYSFQLLAVYVASAIALLLTTSFLGLRRYLRQRKLEMPASMTRAWLGMGVALLTCLMLCALLIPRPQGEYSITGLIDKIDAQARQASKFAVLNGDRAKGEGRRIGDQDSKSDKPGEGRSGKLDPADASQKKAPGGQDSGKAQQGKPGDQQGKDGKPSDSKSGEKAQGQSDKQSKNGSDNKQQNSDQSPQGQNAEAQQNKDQANRRDQQNNERPNQPPDEVKRNDDVKPPQHAESANPRPAEPHSLVSNLMTWSASLVKWILYGVLALVGVYLLIRYWSVLIEILVKLWNEHLSLFVRKRKLSDKAMTKQDETAPRPKRPFASFRNPFSSGAARRMSPPELVTYTFEALEAWSREQAIERPPEQTPLEFAEELGRRIPELANSATQTANLYAQIAYARKKPTNKSLEILERLWRQLSA